MSWSLAAVAPLAGNNFGDTRSGSLAGPMGLLIIVLLAIGTILLIRNMNARLRRLPESFDDPREPPHRTDARRGDSETEPPSAATSGGNTASTDD